MTKKAKDRLIVAGIRCITVGMAVSLVEAGYSG
jgi:hypothetical protein